DEDALALTPAHLVQVPAREMLRIARRERALRFVVVAVAFPSEAAEEWRAAGDDDVECAHRKRRIGILRKVSDALRILARRPLANLTALELDLAAVRRKNARDQFQKRRFP